MPEKYSHLFLKNEARTAATFKKTRDPNIKKGDDEAKNYAPQKERLEGAYRIFNVERRKRHQKRSISVPQHIDYIKVHFFPVFDFELQKKFLASYGLQVIAFEDFNRTVLFSIENEQLFETFKDHLKKYFDHPHDKPASGEEFGLISLIFDFVFLSSELIIHSYDSGIASFQLTSLTDPKSLAIYGGLRSFLEEKEVEVDYLQLNNTLEVHNLDKEDIDLIADNFDIIQSIQSTRTGRVRPSLYGTPIRDYGIEIIPDEKAPLVGVIDTGIQRIDPLKPVLSSRGLDLTNTTPFWDEHGHGTMVSGLIVLGSEYYREIKNTYQAKANLFPIKVLNQDSGNFSHNELIRNIERAHLEEGIRIFNLSVTDRFHKKYNSAFSEYAYALDQLSYKYDLLIFIAAGNISDSHLKGLDDEPHASHIYPNYFYCLTTDSPIHRCELTNISVPAESLNNITVGALASNFEDKFEYGVTPAKEYPASYTRKFHYDYEQQVNGVGFNKNQKNKNLNKPDVVFPGGDLFEADAGIEVLSNDPAKAYDRNAGTSFAAPLVTSLAAQIIRKYPNLNTQTIKALLINSANSACGNNPEAFRNTSHKGLLKKLIGVGVPDEKGILFSDPDSATFIIEDKIKLEEFKAIDLKLPSYLNPSNGSNHKLEVTATLCYKFKPELHNHLNYCPLHISFGFFKSLNEETSITSNRNIEEYRIKSAFTWSEDFWGATRLYSNVQRIQKNLQPTDINELNSTISLMVRCTSKSDVQVDNIKHPFSIVVTITELPDENGNTGRLYNEITAINTVEAIGEIDTDIDIDIS